QHQHDHARHHCVYALERLVVAKTRLEIHGARGAVARRVLRDQIFRRERRDVALGGLGPERHTAIEPHSDVGCAAAHQVATEARWDLDRNLEVAAAEPAIELLAGADRRWPFVEVAPAR